MHGRAAKSEFSGSVVLLSTLGVLIKFLSRASGKKKTKRLKGDDDDELMLNVLRCHLTY